MHDQIDISIIIISYNTEDLIATCLESIIHINDRPKEIFVVDNASDDGSAEFVQKNYPSVHLIENRENKGFAAANNQAMKMCTGRYILLINPDTEFLPATFAPMISFLDAHPQIGLVGIKMINPDGSEQESFSYEYPSQKTANKDLVGLKGSLAWVLGASMFARSDLLKRLGGFDESFFVYGEDQDLCLRIRKAGYEIGYFESAVLVHLGGQSERQTESADVWRKKFRAEFLFYSKHYSPRNVHRITQSSLLKADWRIFTLSLLLFFPFYKSRKGAEDKREKYKVISNVIRHEILKSKRGYRVPFWSRHG